MGATNWDWTCVVGRAARSCFGITSYRFITVAKHIHSEIRQNSKLHTEIIKEKIVNASQVASTYHA